MFRSSVERYITLGYRDMTKMAARVDKFSFEPPSDIDVTAGILGTDSKTAVDFSAW